MLNPHTTRNNSHKRRKEGEAVVADLRGHNGPAWWTLGCVCPWLASPDLLLRIALCSWPWAWFITRNMPDDLGSGLPPQPCPDFPAPRLEVVGRAWAGKVAESTSAPGFPPSQSSWPSWQKQTTSLMGVSGVVKWSQKRTLAHIYHR